MTQHIGPTDPPLRCPKAGCDKPPGARGVWCDEHEPPRGGRQKIGVPVSVALPTGLARDLRVRAHGAGMSVAEVVRSILLEWWQRQQ
jgi:hypothetical protein